MLRASERPFPTSIDENRCFTCCHDWVTELGSVEDEGHSLRPLKSCQLGCSAKDACINLLGDERSNCLAGEAFIKGNTWGLLESGQFKCSWNGLVSTAEERVVYGPQTRQLLVLAGASVVTISTVLMVSALSVLVMFGICKSKKKDQAKSRGVTLRFGEDPGINKKGSMNNNKITKSPSQNIKKSGTIGSVSKSMEESDLPPPPIFDDNMFDKTNNAISTLAQRVSERKNKARVSGEIDDEKKKKSGIKRSNTLSSQKSGPIEFDQQLNGIKEDELLPDDPDLQEALEKLSEASRRSLISLPDVLDADKTAKEESEVLRRIQSRNRVKDKSRYSDGKIEIIRLKEERKSLTQHKEEKKRQTESKKKSGRSTNISQANEQKARPASFYLNDIATRERPESIFRPSSQFLEKVEQEKSVKEGEKKVTHVELEEIM